MLDNFPKIIFTFIAYLILSISFSSFYNQSEDESSVVQTIIQKGHVQPVSAVAYHPSGNYFASGSMDHTIKVWDVHSGKQILSVNIHTGTVNHLSFSKDGNQILSSGMDNMIYVTEIPSGKTIFKYAFNIKNAYPLSVSFSNDESKIIIGDNKDQLIIIDRITHLETFLSKDFSIFTNERSLAPDVNTILERINSKNVRLISPLTNDSIIIDFDKAHNFSFSPDGKTIAIASTKLFAKIFDVKTGKEIHTLVPDEEKKCDGCNPRITYSNDGNSIAMWDKYNGLSIWNTLSGKKIIQEQPKNDSYDFIQFAPDDKTLMLSNKTEVEIFSLQNKKFTFSLEKQNLSFYSPKYSPDGKYVILGSEFHSIARYQISSKKVIQRYKGFFNNAKSDNLIYEYTNWTDAGILNLLKHKNPFKISPDGTQLTQAKIDTILVITDLSNGKPKHILKGHHQQVFAFAYSPDGKTLASGDAEGTIFIWDTQTGKAISNFKAHRDVIFDLTFNSSGTEIVSCSRDNTIKHWNVASEKPELIGYIAELPSNAYGVSFSHKDLYIVSNCLDAKVHLYETDSKELVKSFIGHTNTISQSRVYSKNKLELITASWDGTVKSWDFNTTTLQSKTKSVSKTAILSVVKDVEKDLIYFGSSDRKIYVFDVQKDSVIHSFLAHQSGVVALELHPTENTLFSKSIEGEIKIWNLDNHSEKMTIMQISQQDWLVSEPNGYFDGTSNAMKHINYVSGLKSLEVGSFFKKYFYPDLYKHLQNNNRFIENEDQGINQLMDDIPSFELKFLNFQNQWISANQDTIFQHQSSDLSLEINVNNNPKNIDKISLYNHGKLIQEESFSEEVSFRGSAQKRTCNVTLNPQENNIEIALTTKNGVTTPRKKVTLFFDTIAGQTELFILSIGINEYENNTYNLKFAKNDAAAFSKAVSESASTIFEKVYPIIISDKQATKENIFKEIATIKQKMGPEDAFIFYYAGHGMMYKNTQENTNDFYLIMSNITNLYGDKTMLDAKGISALDLLDISKNLPAQKQVFVLDACQSGAVLNALAVRGVSREKAIAQLARNTGTFFLTASQDVEFANEVGQLKHGIFTYAILELLQGNSDVLTKDETVSIYQLKSYVESRVPELSKLHKGSSQYPTGYSFGNDFPLGVVK